MAADDDGTDAFRGASFTGTDFTGANFRDCALRQVKITDSWLVDVSLSGLVGNLVVNDVDPSAAGPLLAAGAQWAATPRAARCSWSRMSSLPVAPSGTRPGHFAPAAQP